MGSPAPTDLQLFFPLPVPDGVQMWSVVVDSDRMLQLDQRTVQLLAEHRSVVKVTEIPMNPFSGYIMIQTDKVIYTPRQTGKTDKRDRYTSEGERWRR